jgi:DNA-binding MarR family transcriptional regulator
MDERLLDASDRSMTAAMDPSGAGLSDLAGMLEVIFRFYVDAANAAVDEIPCGRRGYSVLTAATCDTVKSQSDLAARVGVDASILVHLLDDLEGAGLVERRTDPADRGKRHVIATRKGRRLHAAIGATLRLAEHRVLAGLPAEEQDAFREMLGRLAVHLTDADPKSNAKRALRDPAAGHLLALPG